MTTFTPGTSANPCTEVELTLSCRNLRNMDLFSKSDPMVVISEFDVVTNKWRGLGRTEVIMNNLNPDFATKLVVEYHFEMKQMLKFDVYDIDTPNLSNLEEHDFLGSTTSTLGQIVSSGRITIPLDGSGEANLGQLIISSEELNYNKDEVYFKPGLRNRRRISCFSWDSVYLEFHKIDEAGQLSLVYRTETNPWTATTDFKPVQLPVRSFCGGDYDRCVKISCFSAKTFTSDKVIGVTSITLRQLIENPNMDIVLTNPHKTDEEEADVLFNGFQVKKVYSFLDYVMGGMQINCTVAIDFTSSNGDPGDANSLHYIHSSRPNSYEQALRAVVDILQDYDSDKKYPVLGFGARIPPTGNVSHCFFANFHPQYPHCDGVEGVLEAYKGCISKIQLFGPTNFAPIINHVTHFANCYQDGEQYFILLIVTDGLITDMMQTKQAIISASDLPMSIIIVGVGPADFSAMDELDADLEPLKVNGRVASRDIVQFVSFRDFQNISDSATARLKLAQEVLAEIPTQVIEFMKSKGFVPGRKMVEVQLPLQIM